jgi:hypothetical protein
MSQATDFTSHRKPPQERAYSIVTSFLMKAQAEADAAARIGPSRRTMKDTLVRSTGCQYYDTCLTYACNNKYQTFTCKGCAYLASGTQKIQISPLLDDEQLEDEDYQ